MSPFNCCSTYHWMTGLHMKNYYRTFKSINWLFVYGTLLVKFSITAIPGNIFLLQQRIRTLARIYEGLFLQKFWTFYFLFQLIAPSQILAGVLNTLPGRKKKLCYQKQLTKDVLKIFQMFQGKNRKCFSVDFEKFLRTSFLQNTSGGYFCYFKKQLTKEPLDIFDCFH